MSITFRLFLLLLCMSVQVCDGRHMRTFHKINKTTLSSLLKDEEKKGFVVIQSKKLEGSDCTDNKVESGCIGTERVTRKRSSKNVKGRRHAGHSKTHDHESLVTVSWRVPHEKLPGEKDPGFNLDYSPPKTHPPSHN